MLRVLALFRVMCEPTMKHDVHSVEIPVVVLVVLMYYEYCVGEGILV